MDGSFAANSGSSTYAATRSKLSNEIFSGTESSELNFDYQKKILFVKIRQNVVKKSQTFTCYQEVAGPDPAGSRGEPHLPH